MVLTFRREGRALLARGGGRCPLRCRRQLIGDHETFWTLSFRNCRQVSWSWGSRGTRGWPRRRLSRTPAFFIWPRPDRENLCLTGLFLFRRSRCHGYLAPESGQDSFALILPGLHGTPSASEAMSLEALAPRSQFCGTPEEVGSAPRVMAEKKTSRASRPRPVSIIPSSPSLPRSLL
jgi:hypothetical protein